jgi:hypothetical protein
LVATNFIVGRCTNDSRRLVCLESSILRSDGG